MRTTRKPTKYPSPAPRTTFPSAKRTKYPTGFPTAGCPAGCVREGEDGWSGDGEWTGDGEPLLRGRRLGTSDNVAALRDEVEQLKAENARQCARIEELEQAARA